MTEVENMLFEKNKLLEEKFQSERIKKMIEFGYSLETIEMDTKERVRKIKELALKHKIDLSGNKYNISEKTKCFLEDGCSIEDARLKIINIFLFNSFTTEDSFCFFKPNGRRVYKNNSCYTLKLAELIDIVYTAMESFSNIEVTTTIKGVKKEKVVLNGNDCERLFLFLNTELEKTQDGLYQYEFNWEDKDYIEGNDIDNFTKPYTKDELTKIIEYERKRYIKPDALTRRLNKKQVRILCDFFKEEGVFNNENKELASKEYQFLYDLLAVVGMFPKETIDRYSASMKKDALRDYIRNR